MIRTIAFAAAALSLAGCNNLDYGDLSSPMARTRSGAPLYVHGGMRPAPSALIPAPLYLARAGASDLFELQSSHLALQKTQNPDVRRFAQTMMDHHARMLTEVAAAAQASGLNPTPPALEPMQADIMAQLTSVPPSVEFDRLYINAQIAAHREALELHAGYAERGDAPPLRQAAARTAPIVAGHLDDATRIGGAL